MQVEVHRNAEEPLEVLSGLGPDLPDARPAGTDDDGLLGLPLDQDRAEQAQAPRLALVVEAIDHHRGHERQLGVGVAQHLLAHRLGREHALGLVGEEVVGIERLAGGEPPDDLPLEDVDPVAGRRRHRHERGEVALPAVPVDERQQARLGDEIDLVEDEQHRRRDPREGVDDEPVAGPDAVGDVPHQPDQVDLADRLEGHVDHAHVHPVQRPVNARGVHEDGLRRGLPRVVAHRHDSVPGGLRLVRDDGQLGADDAVQEGGLAGVGAPDERHEAGAQGRGLRFRHGYAPTGSAVARRLIRTLRTRRRSASSTSTTRSSTSKVSPTAGTRPSRVSR